MEKERNTEDKLPHRSRKQPAYFADATDDRKSGNLGERAWSRQEKRILDLNRTEIETLLVGMSRIAALLWLQSHPKSKIARVVSDARLVDMTGEQLMKLTKEILWETLGKQLQNGLREIHKNRNFPIRGPRG